MEKIIKGITVDYDLIDEQHQDSYWYGGSCAGFNYKGYTFDIYANGDIIATLFDENGEELGYCKDKGNNGTFYWEMSHALHNDEELTEAISNGSLVIENNNWWEVFVTKDNEWYDLMWDLDSTKLFEAIEEAIDCADEIIGCIN